VKLTLVFFTAKEHVVGWYSTGPKLRENDLDVHELFHEYVRFPWQLVAINTVSLSHINNFYNGFLILKYCYLIY